MIKAIIFDLWDTLIPSTVDFRLVARLAKKEHLPLTYFIHKYERAVQLKPYKNFSALHKDFLRAFKREPHELLEEEFKEVYFARTKRINFFPETKKVLLSLRKEGYKTALLSNTENLLTQKIENHTHLSKYFDVMCPSYSIHLIKPDRKAYALVLKKLKVRPHEALMVGDSLRADIFGSKRAGLHNCLINRSCKVIDYKVAKPDFVIKSLKELESVLGELNGKFS